MWLFNLLFSSLSQLWYVEIRIPRSISVSPLEFEIMRVDCIYNVIWSGSTLFSQVRLSEYLGENRVVCVSSGRISFSLLISNPICSRWDRHPCGSSVANYSREEIHEGSSRRNWHTASGEFRPVDIFVAAKWPHQRPGSSHGRASWENLLSAVKGKTGMWYLSLLSPTRLFEEKRGS